MSLETATFVNDLSISDPPGTDKKKQGDDHLRLIKTVLKNTFPVATKAYYFPTTAVKSANFSVLASEMNRLFLITTASGPIEATLPALVAADAGWSCTFLKTNLSAVAYFIKPPSGTIQSGEISGLARARRCIPGSPSRVWWTGTAWIAERVPRVPVGTILDFCGTFGGADVLPTGYEWANSQTLSNAATDYPEFMTRNNNSAIVTDRRGRAAFGKDNMGGAAASARLGFIIVGNVLGAAAGAEFVQLTAAQNGIHSHGYVDPGHHHGLGGQIPKLDGGGSWYAADVAFKDSSGQRGAVGNTTVDASIDITISNSGSSDPHSNLPPAIITNYLVVVE